MEKLTQRKVKELFDYDPITGIVTRKISTCNVVKVGDVVGTINHGHLQVNINYQIFRLHRIIWLWMKGHFPEYEIDHKDRIRYHNWWDNLRESTRLCNSRNTSISIKNTSTVKGVWWNNERKKWTAKIGINKKGKLLYYGDEFNEAVLHRYTAEQCLNWNTCDLTNSTQIVARKILND